MYYYLYDGCLRRRRYEHDVAAIEERIALYGLQGRTRKLGEGSEPVRFYSDRINESDTVVVVGTDETVRRVVPYALRYHAVFGIIPVSAKSEIARRLGIPIGIFAID